MKILFVLNNFYSTGNGLAASARRTVEYLRRAGEDVRILSGPNHETPSLRPEYELKDAKVPIFDSLIQSHGYQFSKPDKDVMRRAVEWADVIHLEEAFVIQWETVKIAWEMGVPCTATYHLHPENMFCSVHLGQWKFLNDTMLRIWRDYVFDYCTDIQCPTENVQKRLERFGFKSRLHLISNGLIPAESRRAKVPEDATRKTPYLVVCIGRFAVEKDQPTLIKSMKYCRHAKEIQLYFAGQGPEGKRLRKMAHKLYTDGVVAYDPVFRFHDSEGLKELASQADIYVHCATVEVEGLSALEALQQAVVPIMAESELTATSQFALDSRSCFPAGDPQVLAERIDYWLDHPEERRRMQWEYAASTKDYDIHKSIESLRAMYRMAVTGEKIDA